MGLIDTTMTPPAGMRALGIYPSDPSRYAVFGAEIHCPCEGEATEAEDGRADLNPPEANGDNPSGNHMVVRCAEEDVDVLLAHMEEDRVAVERREPVKEGQRLGWVGAPCSEDVLPLQVL